LNGIRKCDIFVKIPFIYLPLEGKHISIFCCSFLHRHLCIYLLCTNIVFSWHLLKNPHLCRSGRNFPCHHTNVVPFCILQKHCNVEAEKTSHKYYPLMVSIFPHSAFDIVYPCIPHPRVLDLVYFPNTLWCPCWDSAWLILPRWHVLPHPHVIPHYTFLVSGYKRSFSQKICNPHSTWSMIYIFKVLVAHLPCIYYMIRMVVDN